MTVQVPPLQAAFVAAAALTALVGHAVSRDTMPETYVRPYVVWQVVSALPENTLGCRPEVDDQRCRVFVCADHSTVAREIMQAAVDAVEGIGYVVFGPVSEYEGATKLYRWIFDVEVWTERA